MAMCEVSRPYPMHRIDRGLCHRANNSSLCFCDENRALTFPFPQCHRLPHATLAAASGTPARPPLGKDPGPLITK